MSRVVWKLVRGAIYLALARIIADQWAKAPTGSPRSHVLLALGVLAILILALWFFSGVIRLFSRGGGGAGTRDVESHNYYPALNSDGSLRSQHPERS